MVPGSGFWFRVLRTRTLARLMLLALAAGAADCGGEGNVQDESLAEDPTFAWTPRDEVRAFYSGHSLSDGVPDAVARIAAARGQTWEFEMQTAGYSLLRTRTKGEVSSPTWDGYKTGRNREGSGLDVAQELASPSRISPGHKYDVLVVTERHDLPETAVTEGTATYLADFAKRARQANPRTEVFFYHTWLPLDASAPEPWVRYERRAQRLWECVASRANRDLGDPSNPIRVLPGGTALADLVELFWQGKVPGIADADPGARVRRLFRDGVHPSSLGIYFMGLVHYAFLFGQAPSGTAMTEVADETRLFLEQFAYRQAQSYAPVANAAARRDMDACRLFAANEMCAASYDLPDRGRRGLVFGPYRSWRCRRAYLDVTAPGNPFR